VNEGGPTITKQHTAVLLALLGLGVVAPVLLPAGTSLTWVPVWLGAAIANLALFGALIVLRHAGALRIRYLVLIGVALAIAAASDQSSLRNAMMSWMSCCVSRILESVIGNPRFEVKKNTYCSSTSSRFFAELSWK
jgi:hypothetical protein